MGNIQMSFTIGQYDYETKAAFMGGTGSETSWKRARGVTRIEKCMIALTEDNQYCVFPKASVIARNTNNEGAVGIGVAAAALEPDNTAVSSEYCLILRRWTSNKNLQAISSPGVGACAPTPIS